MTPEETAAHSDPSLDQWFPRVDGSRPAWREVVAIAERLLSAGEPAEIVAWDYQVPLEAVLAVRDWASRWPGAWG